MAWQVVFFSIFFLFDIVSSQIQYSILEEMKQGTIVGNVVKDLGLDVKEITNRKFHFTTHAKKQYFSISLESGILYVIDRIDRDTICGMEQDCFLNLEIVIENPLTVFNIKIEIQDINDNAPRFSKEAFNIEVSEIATPGTRIVLGNAQDPDFGTNSVQHYNLSPNQHFTLVEPATTGGIGYPELVLQEPLDREKQSTYDLVLTASDGGHPTNTATTLVKISVTDANDHYPYFSKDKYQVHLNEDAPYGFLVLHLNATDEDEGSNAHITYSFSHIPENAMGIFTLDPHSGDIRTNGDLDFEVTKNYEMIVEAKDGGGLVSHCAIFIQIIDINDNAPVILMKSTSMEIPESSIPRTVVALFNINDADSGENGDVTCEILEKLPFTLISSSNNYYQIVTASYMDRETIYAYNITIVAEDGGSPPMSTKKTIQLAISDVNDNPPVFSVSNYVAYVSENNVAGASIYSVCASDLDINENAQILYSVLSTDIEGIPATSYVSINSQTGIIYAQRSFDYEQLRELKFQVMAKDRGSPPLNSNVSVTIYIIDNNDNAPKILYPSTDTDETALFEFIPRSSEIGYLVTKVIAVDADSGHNGWLSYHLLDVPGSSLFTIGQQTGEIIITRDLQDTDYLKEKVVVMVKDHGVPSLSATVTLNLVVAENFQQFFPEIVKEPSALDTSSNVTFYLVIAISLISLLFILTVIISVLAKCRKSNTSTPFGTLPRSWYPQLSLTYPSQYSDGSLPLPYSYDVCVTLDSRQNEIAYLRPVQNVPTDNLIDTGDSAIEQDNSMNACLPSDNITQVRHML